MDKAKQKEKEKEESVPMFWKKIDNQENFDNIMVYTVEITTREQNTPEVREAKGKEVFRPVDHAAILDSLVFQSYCLIGPQIAKKPKVGTKRCRM